MQTLQELKDKIELIEQELKVLDIKLDDLPLKSNCNTLTEISIELIKGEFSYLNIELL